MVRRLKMAEAYLRLGNAGIIIEINYYVLGGERK